MIQFSDILVSRTDSIGDVVLTLPLCGILKKYFPEKKIYFLGKNYTKDIVLQCPHVDVFVDKDELLNGKFDIKKTEIDTIIHVFPNKEIAKWAKKNKLKNRIGTSHRLFHINTCNKLVHFSRVKSEAHEAQLNTQLLQPFNIKESFSLLQLLEFVGIKNTSTHAKGKKVILHPKSKGSAREWPLIQYYNLAKNLVAKGFEVFVTGTQEEGKKIKSEMPVFFDNSGAKDYTGKFTLAELIEFISKSDYIIACSTGPLHIGAIFGVKSIGLYPSIKPMHPGRWAPLGKNVKVLTFKDSCKDCKKDNPCYCISSIGWNDVKNEIIAY